MQAFLIAALALALASCRSMHAAPRSLAEPDGAAAVLDDFHDAAAKGDLERYFGHFTADAVFVGTDASEHWTVVEFRAYAAPHFDGVSAWTYVPVERWLRPRGADWCAFEEQLTNAAYGRVRGSGLLVREAGTWKVAQYVLSFPIPNDKAAAVVALLAGRPTE